MAKVERQDGPGKGYTISVRSGASLAPASKPDPKPEFAKFTDLTRKLTQVSKAELDEKRTRAT